METMVPDVRPRTAPADFVMFTRSGGETAETPTEKLVLLPSRDEQNPALHAWADARFWVDIMMEHALFFAMLMPQETAPDERTQALQFRDKFADLLARIEFRRASRPGLAQEIRRAWSSRRSNHSPNIRRALARRRPKASCAAWSGRCSSITPGTRPSG